MRGGKRETGDSIDGEKKKKKHMHTETLIHAHKRNANACVWGDRH